MSTERRLRTAADDWLASTAKVEDHAAFPATASSASSDEGEEEEDDAPEPPANGHGRSKVDAVPPT